MLHTVRVPYATVAIFDVAVFLIAVLYRSYLYRTVYFKYSILQRWQNTFLPQFQPQVYSTTLSVFRTVPVTDPIVPYRTYSALP